MKKKIKVPVLGRSRRVVLPAPPLRVLKPKPHI